ncbi:alpha-L-rhamnosidase-related protein [Halalkalibacter akibai]|uniref:Alfa-L-rhamnosidase n=1 Tax=Halalkalibacter akibai (strain ATCC 43226 / DSM 21942 / CIP 109018 / JCM 9157 / 1139) TaxID=1236973 RepID=W4QV91_HALA3|nr:amylo-alpha-1,6-glucosidase [Halalkalibacter akibai]GAE36001.1 alfa-L-rhamnosidase [Halalkalibacter akibai JCM 9157]
MIKEGDRENVCWIWYPGDWEVWLHEQISVKRKMREVIYPAYWRLDRHYSSVRFTYTYELEMPEEVEIHTDGQFAVYLDGKDNERHNKQRMLLPAGKHEISVAVYNDVGIPALYMKGEHLKTNDEWKVSCYDKHWYQVGCWPNELNDPKTTPSQYRLETSEQHPVTVEKRAEGWFVDFGKETFGFLQLNGIKGQSDVTVYYGESREEAEDRDHCVLLDRITVDGSQTEIFTLTESRAYRYVQIVPESNDFQLDSISMLYEYLPVDYRGRFRSSNDQLNQIWVTSQYTFHLNTREFFFDGIKRDRWVWSGDAYQSFLLNYYSFFDRDVVKRTLVALRGKDPIVTHLNTIVDYSLYWFSGIYDYYLYTGDDSFVKSQYERMLSLMDFCLGRRNNDGLMEGIEKDWVFVDWADLDNRGEVSTIQLLLCRSLETMALVSQLVGDSDRVQDFQEQALTLKEKIIDIFWNENIGGLVHSRADGILNSKVTKYPNMFALMFGYLNDKQAEEVKKNVLLNPDVQPIKTPYMRFYELASLCEVGEHQFVLEEMLQYWGGMLDLGATSFWEEYDPNQTGTEHFEMYGMRYGKSLCHAWGASPMFLIGKYYLGVKPLSPGYETFMVEPHLGGLVWMDGTVPINEGDVEIFMDSKKIRVRATYGHGILRYEKNGEIRETEIPVDGNWLEVVR